MTVAVGGRVSGGRREVAVGLLLLGATAVPTQLSDPPGWELRSFHVLNRLPDGLHAPVWAVMQLGALGAAPVTAAAALLAGDRPLAGRLLLRGATAWMAAKAVKRVVGRGRPAGIIAVLRLRGQTSADDGFPSGHAAVATALLGAIGRSGDPGLRAAVTTLAAAVAAARVYVGAHLPLDVLGGVAVGRIVDGSLRLGEDRWHARRCE